jgi:hypothetical protein
MNFSTILPLDAFLELGSTLHEGDALLCKTETGLHPCKYLSEQPASEYVAGGEENVMAYTVECLDNGMYPKGEQLTMKSTNLNVLINVQKFYVASADELLK